VVGGEWNNFIQVFERGTRHGPNEERGLFIWRKNERTFKKDLGQEIRLIGERIPGTTESRDGGRESGRGGGLVYEKNTMALSISKILQRSNGGGLRRRRGKGRKKEKRNCGEMQKCIELTENGETNG